MGARMDGKSTIAIAGKTIQNNNTVFEDVSMINEIALLLIVAEHDRWTSASQTLRKALDIQEYRGSHADPEVIQSYLYCYGQ